ncbi:PH domain-containing protein [Flavobacterium sp.]|jgi:membrane protein YdbS with pleckstrin-like domain|uniref:PH domain-containing protein n=1 Tax=Flavobacterium sp. TaxID=239 RepID=UPI0037BEF1E2
MENFTNETINTKQLPRYESVELTSLHKNYWKVLLINNAIIFSIIAIIMIFLWMNIEDSQEFSPFLVFGIFLVIVNGSFFLNRISFKKKAYAFRNHDVIYRSGLIATNTMVIPYNRVQHVALHEGFLSRYFGLAKVEIFTAGGTASDIEIPGIAKEEAENIKQLLMGKIQKQL